ncbi:MAG: hypothetical protein M1818_000804 [Claussenomyces sp. TS43310]|nr:MAG: hypothetical protein M1818_000804 [Claussenomyces sp. TS43310]
MAIPTMSVEEQLKQLDDARKLVLGDANYYPQIVQGILPIIGLEARVELRRWGADFLAETFSSPSLPTSQKENLSLIILDTLKFMIENPNEDPSVMKSIVQTAASIYPLVFRWIINNPYDGPTWERMTAIKSRVLKLWDSTTSGVRICCIKFAQRVVLVQTNGPVTDRGAGPLDISLAIVPQTHPLIPPRNLEAEASGLLDRMLEVLHENTSDAVRIDATLNSLSILIRARPPIAHKILTAILNFNPLKLANSPMTSKLRVMVKSMEKTTRLLLIHVNKRDPQNPLAARIHQHIERLMRSRTEIFEEASRKRGPPEPVDGLDAAKRQRLGADIKPSASRIHVPLLAPGSHSISDLFTVTNDEGLKAFDVSQLSQDLVIKIAVTILAKLDSDTFNQTINGIRDRYSSLVSQQQTPLSHLNPNTAPLGVDDDDDDYEPDFQIAEDTEQILNKLDGAPPEDEIVLPAGVAIGPFTMPPPPAMTSDEVVDLGRNTINRVFGMMQTLGGNTSTRARAGINRLAASSNDKDAWITLITRLATRSISGLEGSRSEIKVEDREARHVSLSSTIRESLYLYVIEDFRKRIDIAVSWLCEEWYNDKLQLKENSDAILHYETWVLRVLDGIIPYLDARDKVLTRFLSEIPDLSIGIMERVKGLCRDPAMVNLALTSLLYLVMMRPPAREMALDAVQDIWKTCELKSPVNIQDKINCARYADDDARPMASKYLGKWRPGYLETNTAIEEAEGSKLGTPHTAQNGVSVG